MELPFKFSIQFLTTADGILAMATFTAAITAMWRAGHQQWRRPVDMWARRISLAFVAATAIGHSLGTIYGEILLPDISHHLSIVVLVVVLAFDHPNRQQIWQQEQDSKNAGHSS